MSQQQEARIGTSGFSFPDWRGTVYPATLKREDALRYYASELGFDCVEINSTYYTIVGARSFAGMEKKTPDGFDFVVKGFKGFTHDPFDGRLKERPSLKEAEKTIQRFLDTLEPLRAAGKLGAVLLQFPPMFMPSPENFQYLETCRELFKDVSLAVEFRNGGWAKDPYYNWMKRRSIAVCTVDEPKIGSRLMPWINRVTAEIAYFRLHGRNPKWFNSPMAERYDYLYSREELESFVPEIEKGTEESGKSFVFFNNCHRGQALINAQELKRLLKQVQRESPPAAALERNVLLRQPDLLKI